MRRFFVSEITDTQVITGEDHNHIAFVLRCRVGDKVVLCPQDGYDYIAEITAITKMQTDLKMLSREINIYEPSIDVCLFCAVTKGDKLELIAQKATELGANKIVPFMSQFVQAKQQSVKVERITRIMDEAAKQCNRGKLAKIDSVNSFSQMVAQLKAYDLIVFPYEKAEGFNLKTLFLGADNAKSVAIIVGSEGGFSAQEVQQLANAGAKPVTLGKRILRAETANIAALSIVMYQLNQLN